MKITNYILILIFIIIPIIVLSQVNHSSQNNQTPYYYYYQGGKIYLNLDTSNLYISTKNNFDEDLLNNQGLLPFELKTSTKQTNGEYKLWSDIKLDAEITEEDYYQKLNSIKTIAGIESVQPSFITMEGIEINMSSYFYVKLNQSSEFNLLQQEAINKNVVIIEQDPFMPLWYTLKCTSQTNETTLEVANYFFEELNFSCSVPDFLSDDIFCKNDTDFNQLWGLLNPINPDIDINVCEAWGITEGNDIIVAVVDTGIDLNHIDLQNNIFPASYDSETDTQPSMLYNPALGHGTHVAGTIGAVGDNENQVVGVAPQSMLMSVSNSLGGNENSRINRGRAINWAWQNGADVISNSWGSAVQYDPIDDAINNALMNGRDGKGTIILFATGNDFGNVAYPANSNPDIISVGAIDQNGQRGHFSNFGNEIDIVAPGVDILSTLPFDETIPYSGTSMATPHIAGVVALILSVNPELTAIEVNEIIEATAQKVGGYNYENIGNRPNGTWNNEMGYGLVDALGAVQLAETFGSAFSTNGNISCENLEITFTLVGNSLPFTWSYSSNLLELVDSSDTFITLKALDNENNGFAFVQANFSNTTEITETFWVGKPRAYTTYPDPTICAGVFIQEEPNDYSLPISPGALTYQVASNHPNLIVESGGELSSTPPYNLNFIATQPGNYTATLTTTNECGIKESTIYIVADNEYCPGDGWNMPEPFPNSSDTSFKLDFRNKPATTQFYIYLFDQFQNIKYEGASNNVEKTIDTINLQNGVYYLHVYENGELKTKQIFVNH